MLWLYRGDLEKQELHLHAQLSSSSEDTSPGKRALMPPHWASPNPVPAATTGTIPRPEPQVYTAVSHQVGALEGRGLPSPGLEHREAQDAAVREGGREGVNE